MNWKIVGSGSTLGGVLLVFVGLILQTGDVPSTEVITVLGAVGASSFGLLLKFYKDSKGA